MTLKLNQTQIFFGVISLTLGIMVGSVSLGYFLGHDNTQKSQIAADPKPGPVAQNLARNATNIAQSTSSKPATENKSSAATTAVTLDIAEAKPEELKPEAQKNELELQTSAQVLKNLKINLDKIDFTKTTLFQDPNSKISEDETFVLLNLTLENISDKVIDLDGRAYLIEILDEKMGDTQDKNKPKQVVYKPARELGPTFSQSKSTLIKKGLQPKQKFSGVVGFKIPKETTTLNFYYPDVLDSKEIALFKLR